MKRVLMRCIAAVITFSLDMQAHAKDPMDKLVYKLINKTFDGALNVWFPCCADLESTMISVLGHFEIPALHNIRPATAYARQGIPQFMSCDARYARPVMPCSAAVTGLRGLRARVAAGETGKETSNTTTLGRLKRLVFGGEELTKARLAAMGGYAFISYGLMSNLNYTILLLLAWATFAKASGLSPLAPEQWKPFLAVYAGYWMIGNVMRPFRVAAAMAIAPLFRRLIAFFRERLKVPTPIAFGVTIFVVNMVMPCSLLALGVCAITWITGVPPGVLEWLQARGWLQVA